MLKTEFDKQNDINFYDRLMEKLLNDYNYYLNISIISDNKSEIYENIADGISDIIDWCKVNKN